MNAWTSGLATVAIRVGFVPLVDAAPLIVAHEKRFFADEGLAVTLHRQIGWGNVRDKLTFGQLDASHALLGMTPVSIMGRDQFAEPLVAIVSLGSGGNAITLSRRLIAMGVTSAEALSRLTRRRETRVLTLAHVFSCSTHHYLLRDWLASARIGPDEDVRLCVLPPPQMVRQMTEGMLDGFCVGEPWSTLAERQQQGGTVIATTRLVPDHPEKVLAVSRRWVAGHGEAAERLVRAVLRGCAFCEDESNANELAEMLAQSRYLDVPADVLSRTLAAGRAGFRSWAPCTTFPSATHAVWLLGQMARWGHVPAAIDAIGIARQSVVTAPYRRAAESLGWPCPQDDFPPMRLRDGPFDPRAALVRKRRAGEPAVTLG